MKKIIVTAAALFCVGFVSAQTPPQKPEKKDNPATNTTPEVIEDVKEASETKRDIINKQNEDLEVQPRKDEIKTRKHIKSTPTPSRVKDTSAGKAKTKTKH